MTRLTRTQTRELAGWTGGVREDAEPALAIAEDGAGRLRAGENFVHQSGLRLVRRGGTRRALVFAENAISDVLAVGPWSPTGALVISHSATGAKHYAHAITDAAQHALPIGTPTESGSRVALPTGWDGASPGRPQLVELFERAFVADGTPDALPRPLLACALAGGALTVAPVVADLDGDSVTGAVRPAGVAVHNGVLFAWGWEDETIGRAPHMLRHTLLGQSPADVAAWDPDANAIIGAHGQPIRAARSGQGVLLVAKEAELYRITGTPDALPGWQFGIQQVDNSRGAGCAGPLALDVADNVWWGIGRAGPWRCDGARVELLRSGRSASWAAVGDPARAFVVHHPRRRAVAFGFVESARGAGAPTVQWWWDLDRDTWMPNQRPPVRVHVAASIAPAGTVLSPAPSQLRQLVNNGAFRRTRVQLAWTLGRPDLATEVWLRSDTTAAQLVATVQAGVPGVILTDLPPGAVRFASVRHVGAQTTEFSAEVPIYTAVPSPRLALPVSPAAYRVTADVAGPVRLRSLNATATPVDRELSVAAGLSDVPVGATPPRRNDAVALLVEAIARRPVLPDMLELSPPALAATYAWRDGVAVPAVPPLPTQVLDSDAWAETAITVQVCPHADVAQAVAVQWRRFGTGDWVTADLRTLPPSAAPYTVTIPGLLAGERYGVRCTFDPPAAGASPEVEMFTAVPAPGLAHGPASLSAPLSGGFEPVILTVTPPNSAVGYDIVVATIDASVEALYTAVPGTPQSYEIFVPPTRPLVLLARARRPDWPPGLEWGPAATLVLA